MPRAVASNFDKTLFRRKLTVVWKLLIELTMGRFRSLSLKRKSVGKMLVHMPFTRKKLPDLTNRLSDIFEYNRNCTSFINAIHAVQFMR